MRKLIKLVINFSLLIWFFSLLIFIINRTIPNTDWLFYLVFIFGISMFFLNFYTAIRWTHSGLDRDWFRSQEELIEEKKKLKEEWEKVYNMRTIIGNHEAIKFYNENKNEKV